MACICVIYSLVTILQYCIYMLINGCDTEPHRLHQYSISQYIKKAHRWLHDMASKSQQKLNIATAQVHTVHDSQRALDVLESRVRKLSAEHVDLVLFPEVFVGGFPRLSTFGNSAIGTFGDEKDYNPWVNHWRASADLGDTPKGAGQKWIKRELPRSPSRAYRGDGTRERLEKIAADTGVFIIVGVVERSGGTLYSSIVYVCPRLGIIGKRRKVMPTGLERVAWGQGSPSTLEAVSTTIKGIKLRMSGKFYVPPGALSRRRMLNMRL